MAKSILCNPQKENRDLLNFRLRRSFSFQSRSLRVDKAVCKDFLENEGGAVNVFKSRILTDSISVSVA